MYWMLLFDTPVGVMVTTSLCPELVIFIVKTHLLYSVIIMEIFTYSCPSGSAGS
jgi:hypothetical protein